MSEAFRRAVKQIVAPLERRLNNMLARGVITGLSNLEGYQGIQATLHADEVADGAEFIENYGFTSRPPLGSEVVVLFLNGDRSHPIVLSAGNRKYRPKDLNDSDSAMYSILGNRAVCQEDGTVLLQGVAGNTIALLPTGEIVITVGAFALVLGLDGVFRNTGGKLRFESDEIELHATSSLKLDAGGTGLHATPGGYVFFGTPTAAPSSPPEIP